MAERSKKTWLRRLRWPGAIVALLGVILYGLVPLIATPMLRTRLQKQISTQLNAELRMGGVYYLFPYGVRVSDAVLVGKDENGAEVELLKIPKLKLALAKLPFGEGPLVFKKVVMDRPAIRLIDTETGLVGRRTLVKAQTQPASAPAAGKSKWEKLSEMLELRRFSIEDGSIVYEDRQSPGTVPAVWRNIDIDLTTTPVANPIYQYQFKASNGAMAEVNAAGTFNVDELELVVSQIAMKLNLAAGGKESPVPAVVQKMLLDNNVSGNFVVSGTAKAPLRKMEEAEFDFHVDLIDGAARIAKWQSDKDEDQTTLDKITGKFRCSSEPLSEDQILMGEAGKIRGASTRASTRPKQKMPAAYLLAESAEIQMGDSLLSVKNATAAYDRRISQWQVKQAKGVLTLGKHKEDLPKPLRAATEKPQFFGVVELVLDGEGSMNKPRGGRRTYAMRVKATCPQLTMTPRKLVWNNVGVNMLITPGLVQFVDEDATRPAIAAELYGGKLIGHGAIRTGKPARYDIAGSITNVDLREFARDWTRSEEKLSKLSGRAFATLQFSGATSHGGHPALDLLSGGGVFEILDGEFYELPILEDVASVVGLSKDAGKVGQAAGKFSVAHRTIHFQKIAVAAPILGLQGEGKATFDGALDFKVVAAPLADWKKALQKTNIPLLDSVGAELLGGVQKILDTASGKLLYQFRITGTTKKPNVKTEAVPILTEDGAKLFKEMLRGTGKLIDSL